MSTLSIQESINLSHLVTPSDLSASANSSSSDEQQNITVSRTEAVASSTLSSSVSASSSSSNAQMNAVLGMQTILSSPLASLDIGTSSSSSASSASAIVNIQDEMQITQEDLIQWISTNRKIEFLIRKMLNLLISNVSNHPSLEIQRQARVQMTKQFILEEKEALSNELKDLEVLKRTLHTTEE